MVLCDCLKGYMITTKNGSYFPIFWEQSLCLRYLYYEP